MKYQKLTPRGVTLSPNLQCSMIKSWNRLIQNNNLRVSETLFKQAINKKNVTTKNYNENKKYS